MSYLLVQKILTAGITSVCNRIRINHAQAPTKSVLEVISIPILPLFINIGNRFK